MKFYLAGQTDFGNRGCEALIRSITDLLHVKFKQPEILSPTFDAVLDARQWPEYKEKGVRFVNAFGMPTELLWWNRLVTRVPIFKNIIPPFYKLPGYVLQDIQSCDCAIMTGGDILGLEYGYASLFHWTLLVDKILALGKPVILWGASVGPFSTDKYIEEKMIAHLKRYSAITVRETASYEYLKKLGITNVVLVADPAFVLQPQPFDDSSFLPVTGDGIVGLNVSPLIAKFRKSPEDALALQDAVANFVRDLLAKTNYSLMLIPHVDPLTGGKRNSDSHYMQEILAKLPEASSQRLTIAPSTLNAAQLKFILSKCRFFIGARTHATIGAMSMHVPTISIAYSIKALGLNKDMFGDTRYVLETPSVSEKTLWSSFKKIESDEAEIKALLRDKVRDWRKRAELSVYALAEIVK